MKVVYLHCGLNRKPVDVYLVTNCVDDAYVYISKTKAEKKMSELPDYTLYVWPQLEYFEFRGDMSIQWRRARKKNGNRLEFDDTKTPWKMLLLAQEKHQWYTNRKFDSIQFAMGEFGDREYYNVCGYDVPKEKESNNSSVWVRGFADAKITDRQWLVNYKDTLHPNDDWTDVNVETYARWLNVIDDDEHDKLVNDALKAHVVGFLE